MKAIIVGGGIAGLATAIGLINKGMEVEVYESAAAFKPVGAAILLAPNGLEVLRQLSGELLDEVMDRGGRIDQMLLTTYQGKRLGGSMAKEGKHSCAIHRADLIDILKSRIPANALHVGKSFESYQENPDHTIQVHFEDGSHAQGDFLVGTDGIKSQVRQQMLGDLPYRYSGQTCWRAIVPYQLPSNYQNTFVEAWGKTRGLRVGFGAVNPQDVYFFATYFTEPNGQDNRANLKDHLMNLYQDFMPVVTDFLQVTPVEAILRNDIYDLVPIHQWYHKQTVLVGDAAHATTPNMGQGGNQALESAWVLSQCINTKANLSESFAQYQQMRVKKAHKIVSNSWKISQMVNLRGGLLRGLRNKAIQMVPDKVSQASLRKVYALDYKFE
ncbi:MAG TPA: hypothetical protein DCS93_34355 [Microscillaceae bacterium]|nr:hypothetical protein [Microscillaceae bacterium]